MMNVTRNTADFQALSTVSGLYALDQRFLSYLQEEDHDLYDQLIKLRAKMDLSPTFHSAFIMALAPHVESFVIGLFAIEQAAEQLQSRVLSHQPVLAFKQQFVLKRARRVISQAESFPAFDVLTEKVLNELGNYDSCDDLEMRIAQYGMHLLSDSEKNAPSIDQLVQWCAACLTTAEGKIFTQGWAAFALPQKRDFDQLVKTQASKEDASLQEVDPLTHRQREGFELTDKRMPLRERMAEVDYCVYCHKNDGDFCSKGFPIKKKEPELGLKTDPLGNVLTGCPLEEKISEMHLLQREGYSIAALAVVMIDNPMCPVTGHRICNDCMKACIYQKQDPVDIPQIETGVLTDVLSLPYGVEIYDLLTKWNPLRHTQYLPQDYSGRKVLVMGMGPAGFTLAHHLLMEGCAVVGMDGLKIEALPEHLINQPIKSFDSLTESLADRLVMGFGGVAEYGITVRWDKNFLKLIYITLMRRAHFQLFGGVRFGGTLTVDDAWRYGFDHLALAVGAGLPKELSIPNSLVPGMRQANDFLMALQLTGAAKENSVAPLQIRLPAIVIGGGLTGVDTATEVQAYYIKQITKIEHQYNTLLKESSANEIRSGFSKEQLVLLDEWLEHAQELKNERHKARALGNELDIISLVRRWGGVSVVYRQRMQKSPAYRLNHEELSQALREGIYYREQHQPLEVLVDQDGHASVLRCVLTSENEEGGSVPTQKHVDLPAKSILVATGAKPNVAYAFEHKDTFNRERFEYQSFQLEQNQLIPSSRDKTVKDDNIGVFTSYERDHYRVSFIGDTHPVFHGSVVNAVASAKYAYPKIMQALVKSPSLPSNMYSDFRKEMRTAFSARVVSVSRLSSDCVALEIMAPQAYDNTKPGQFFRIQQFESDSPNIGDKALCFPAIACVAIKCADRPGVLRFLIDEKLPNTEFVKYLQPMQSISLMGPTGSKTHIDADSSGLFIGDYTAIAHILSFATQFKMGKTQVSCILLLKSPDELVCLDALEAACEQLIVINQSDASISLRRDQDRVVNLNLTDCLQSHFKQDQWLWVHVIGSAEVLREVQCVRSQGVFSVSTRFVAAVYGPMQCMLKGVCAQCLQWQVDPETGKRTKAVYACSWQNQPMDIIDIDHMAQRNQQNQVQERLTRLWLGYIYSKNELPSV